jgi:hypothetical protein
MMASLMTAQTETLFSKADIRFGGFGGPIVEYSTVNDQAIVDVGGGGGLLINDFFIGGYGMGSDVGTLQIDGASYDLEMSHGGVWLGYSYKSHKLIHPYISVRAGGGELTAENTSTTKFDDRFFVVSPDIGIELNLARWFKVVATAGYRFTNMENVDIPNVSDNAADSFTAGLTFRFGLFNHKDTSWED